MNLSRKVMSVFLLLCSIMMFVTPVKAAGAMAADSEEESQEGNSSTTSSYAEHQGLKVMVTMDKEEYDEGEPITATISVFNAGNQSVTVANLEQLIPEGYVLSENSEVSTKDVDIQPGQTIELQVTFEGAPVQPGEESGQGTFWDKLFYGEFLGIPNIILVVIVVVGFIIFMALT